MQQKDMDVGIGPALLLQILELRIHHGAALFCLPLAENKNEQRNAGITALSSTRRKTWKYAASFCGGNPLQPCTGRSIGRSRDMMKYTNNALQQTNLAAFHDLQDAVSKLRTANDAISVLVSALTYQVTAQTLNQHGCDYCGARYQEPGPIAWTSHHCNVLVASETIISECVQQLLRDRGVVKNEIERYLFNRSFLRRAM
jgi:hypothetical protein